MYVATNLIFVVKKMEEIFNTIHIIFYVLRSVIYVGGQVGGTEPSPNLYRLSAPLTRESQWEILPQKMKTPRIYMTAFFIPDNFVECHDVINEDSSTLT